MIFLLLLYLNAGIKKSDIFETVWLLHAKDRNGWSEQGEAIAQQWDLNSQEKYLTQLYFQGISVYIQGQGKGNDTPVGLLIF